LILDQYEIACVLKCFGVVDPDITGVVLQVENGDYKNVWASESTRPYDMYARYRPVEYFK
jgi:hypothetical protein